LKEEYLNIIQNSAESSLESYYIDDKYVYIYEKNEIGKTLIFDHKFSYIGAVDMKVIATVGENLICVDENKFVSVKREEIFDKFPEKLTIMIKKSEYDYEWPEKMDDIG